MQKLTEMDSSFLQQETARRRMLADDRAGMLSLLQSSSGSMTRT